MNRIILSVIMGVAAILCRAEEADGYKMQVLLNDSTIEEVCLSEKPVVTFTDSTLVLSTDSIVCELGDIDKIIFIGGPAEPGTPEEPEPPAPPTGITAAPVVKISYANQILRIEGIRHEEKVIVSDVRGMVQEVSPVYDGDNTIVELGHLPKGIYIIKVKNQTIKITIR